MGFRERGTDDPVLTCAEDARDADVMRPFRFRFFLIADTGSQHRNQENENKEFPPCSPLAPGKIGQVVPMLVSLALKRYVAVCLLSVAELQKPEKPFQHVKEIKRDVKQFLLLGIVDALMVYYIAVDPRRVASPIGPEQVEAISLTHQRAFYDDRLLHEFSKNSRELQNYEKYLNV